MAFFLGKRPQGDLILYEAAQPLKRYKSYTFTGAIGPFLSRLGASYYARCGRDNPGLTTPADAERLAREDNTGAWPAIRELLAAEMLLMPEELEAARFEVACEYEPDTIPPVAQSIELESLSLCDTR
jgi:hypothetical protein